MTIISGFQCHPKLVQVMVALALWFAAQIIDKENSSISQIISFLWLEDFFYFNKVLSKKKRQNYFFYPSPENIKGLLNYIYKEFVPENAIHKQGQLIFLNS